jgi:hypothetical protein
MGWLKDLYRKTTAGVQEPKVVDYPFGQYKVYWEVVTVPVDGGFSSEVRFIGYDEAHPREQFTLVGPTQEHIKERINVLITDYMENYKR